MKEVLVSKTNEESIFYILDPDDPSLDARVERNGESMEVSFWPYVSRTNVRPIKDTLFHKNLWDGDPKSMTWYKKFFSREMPFDEDELESIGFKPFSRSGIDVTMPAKKKADKMTDKQKSTASKFADYRALSVKTTAYRGDFDEIEIRTKVGIVESNDRVVRALQGAASIAIPGDLSNIRKPIRSNIYEALTPGPPGLPNRPRLLRRALARGERNQLRCPPGFEGGGRFAKKDLSNCGLRIFDLPGFGLVSIGEMDGTGRGKKPNVGEAIRGVNVQSQTTSVRDPGSVAPIEGTPTDPNVAAVSDIDISRVALINTVGELNAQAREDAIEKAIPVAVKANSPDFGRLVRKDGTMLDNVVPLVRLADVRNSEDMDRGFLVTSITDPDKFAVDEFQVFSAGLDGIVMATPDGKGFIRLEKVPGAGSIRGMRRRWGTILRDQPEGTPGAAFDQLVQESGKKLRLSVQYPGIQNPLEMVEIERDGAKRSVRKWVYALFLSSEAPMRPKSTSAWRLVEDVADDRKAKKEPKK